MTVHTPGHLLALHVTPAGRHDRAEVGRLPAAIQDATDGSVELASVAGKKPAGAARALEIALEVIRLPEAKRGFILLQRRWVEEGFYRLGIHQPTAATGLSPRRSGKAPSAMPDQMPLHH